MNVFLKWTNKFYVTHNIYYFKINNKSLFSIILITANPLLWMGEEFTTNLSPCKYFTSLTALTRLTGF